MFNPILTQIIVELQQNIEQLDEQIEYLRKQVYELSDEYYEQLIEQQKKLFQQLEEYNDVCMMLGKEVDGLEEDVLGLEGIEGRYQQQIGQLQVKKIQLQRLLKTQKQAQQSTKTLLSHHTHQLTQAHLTFRQNTKKHKYLQQKQKQLDIKIQTLTQNRRYINNIKTQQLLNYQNNSCLSNDICQRNISVNANKRGLKTKQLGQGGWKGCYGSVGKEDLRQEEEDTLETLGSKGMRGNFVGVADQDLATLNQFCL